MRPPAFFPELLERALNEALEDSPRARDLVGHLEGRTCRVELRELEAGFLLEPAAGRVRVGAADETPADVTISGTLPALLRANFDREGLPEGVRVSGDAALAQRFQQLLAEAEFDWEARLARVLGDAPAHQLARAGRGLYGWAREAVAALGDSLAEYLREESALLPRRAEVEAFLREVDVLRDDVARLEARLARLERHS